MDPEECVPAQYFDVPVLEVEGFMWGYGRRIDGRLVIRNICGREIGKSGNADGRRPSGRRRRNRSNLWSNDRFEWRGLRDMGFEICVWETQSCSDWSGTRVVLVRATSC